MALRRLLLSPNGSLLYGLIGLKAVRGGLAVTWQHATLGSGMQAVISAMQLPLINGSRLILGEFQIKHAMLHNIMHSGIQTSEMLALTSLCDMSHVFKIPESSLRLHFCQINGWLELPCGISHVRK